MNPRSLDLESTQAKLALMRRMRSTLLRLGAPARLEEDWDLRLIAERAVTQLVDLAIAINAHLVVVELGEAPYGYRQSFELAARAGIIDQELARQLAPSVGLRNVLIHQYVDLDLERLVGAIPLAVEQYGRYIEQVASYLRTREGGAPLTGR